MRHRRLAGAAMMTLSGLSGVAAEDADPAATVRALLAEPPRAEQFSDDFLAQVPLVQIEALLEDLRETIGEPTEIAVENERFTVTSASHAMNGTIALDDEGRIAGLFFEAPLQTGLDAAAIAAQFDDFEGEVSYLVVSGGEIVAERNADAPLAVGSAFKLGIVALIKDGVAAGTIQWDEVLTLEERHISLPSGIMQTWPVGAPVTVHTAATLMIALSDNTATDLLIERVGREALAERLGIEFSLTTREFFFLKGDIEAREAYLAADPEQKARIVGALADRPMPPLNAMLSLHDEGVEWYVPARRLCDLIASVADLGVMSVNPGPTDAGRFASVAYKGGSETGVLNLTTHLVDEAGVSHCVVLTLNADRAISGTTQTSIYASLTAALAEPRP